MNRQVFCSTLLIKLQSVLANTSIASNSPSNVVKRNLKKAVMFGGLYNVIKPPEELERDVKKACETAENAIVSLMNVIKQCIHEISEEYRICVQKQIDIIKSATDLGPVGAHWDDLTKYRVQANDLKQELDNYRTLLRNLGNIAHEQSVVSLLSGAKDTLELITDKYNKLNELVEQEYSQNFHYELNLLYASRDHILRTGAKRSFN